MNKSARKHIIVTGTESSGGSLVARTIAHAFEVSHFDAWDGMGPNAITNQIVKVQHVSLPAGNPAEFPNVREWIVGDDEDGPRVFVLTVRDNGISIRSKMRRAEGYSGLTFEEAQRDNARAARLLAEISSSHRPHLFFSYEALIFLGHVYLQDLYRFLGVESEFVPPMIDANARYLKPPLQEGGPRETVRPLLQEAVDDSQNK